MATYKQIQDDIKTRDRRMVKTCWIADVKELNGLTPKRAPNRRTEARKYPCPAEVRPLIEASMRRFGML
jgi:hypothetical protein